MNDEMVAADAALPAVEYREVPGFPGYRVGSDGSVWSCHKRGRPAAGTIASRLSGHWRPVRTNINDQGREVAVLNRNGKPCNRRVHSLVLLAFVGPNPPGTECCHGDGDCRNNRLGNLRWGTKKDNGDDARRHGIRKGERNGFSKLTAEQVMQMRRLHAAGDSLASLARRFGVSASAVHAIVRGQKWSHLPLVDTKG